MITPKREIPTIPLPSTSHPPRVTRTSGGGGANERGGVRRDTFPRPPRQEGKWEERASETTPLSHGKSSKAKVNPLILTPMSTCNGPGGPRKIQKGGEDRTKPASQKQKAPEKEQPNHSNHIKNHEPCGSCPPISLQP